MVAGPRLGYVAVVASLAILISAVGAQAATVVTWTGPDDFETAQIEFGGFTANSLTAIVSPPTHSAYFQNRTVPERVFTISVYVGDDWVEIYNFAPKLDQSVQIHLSTLTPLFFAPGEITKLKLAVNSAVHQAYHNISGTQFSFDLVATPLPAALPLFGGGLALMALLSWRRRRALALRPV